MLECSGRKRALIIGNVYDDKISRKKEIKILKTCDEDIIRMKQFLLNVGFEEKRIYIRKNVFPEKYVKKIIERTKENDLLFIHFSGHGEGVGVSKNGKMKLVTGWLNPDKTLYLSSEIERKISKLKNSKIFISSDCCFSGRFFKEFENFNNNEIYFTGSSTSLSKASAYSLNNKNKSGSLVLLYEFIYEINKFKMNFDIFMDLKTKFVKETKIGSNRIILKKV